MAKITSSKEYKQCETEFDSEYCKVNEMSTQNVTAFVIKKMKQLSDELKIKAKTNIKDINYFLPAFIRDTDSLFKHINQCFENLSSLFKERSSIRRGYSFISWKNKKYEEDSKLHSEELAKVRKETTKYCEELEKLQEELRNAKNEIKQLSEEKANILKSLSEMKLTSHEYLEQLEDKKNLIQELKKNILQFSDQLKQARDESAALQSEKQSLILENKKLVIILNREKNEKSNLDSELSKIQKALDCLNFEKKFLVEDLSLSRKEIEEIKEKYNRVISNPVRRDLENEIEKLKQSFMDSNLQYEHSQERLISLQKDFDDYKLIQAEKLSQLAEENKKYSEIIANQLEDIDFQKMKLLID